MHLGYNWSTPGYTWGTPTIAHLNTRGTLMLAPFKHLRYTNSTWVQKRERHYKLEHWRYYIHLRWRFHCILILHKSTGPTNVALGTLKWRLWDRPLHYNGSLGDRSKSGAKEMPNSQLSVLQWVRINVAAFWLAFSTPFYLISTLLRYLRHKFSLCASTRISSIGHLSTLALPHICSKC